MALYGLCAMPMTQGKVKALSVADARTLAYDALPVETKRLPGLALAAGKTESSGRCVTFDVLWTNPGPGSAHIIFYTIDLQTAAIWSGPRPPATLETGQAVLRRQRVLRKKLGLTARMSESETENSPCWR